MAGDILALYDAALEQLRGLGAEIVPFEPAMAFDTMKEGAGTIIASEGYYHHGALYDDADALVDEDVRPRITMGSDIKARDYVAALVQRQADQLEFHENMRGLAAVLTPTIATAAVPLGEVAQTGTPAGFTRAANYLGLCALSLPDGLTPEGLPSSLQIMARAGDEDMAIRIGAAYEAAHGGIGLPTLDDG